MSVNWLSKECPKCGKTLEKPTLKCPECGYSDEENMIAKYLHHIGVAIIFLGILGSIILGNIFPTVETNLSTYSIYKTVTEESFNWMLFLVGSLSSAISGLLMIGFGELISLNQKIVNLMKR